MNAYESEFYDRGGGLVSLLWSAKTIQEARETYIKNKAAKIGEHIFCTCGVGFTKKTKTQAFHKLACKDRFWNTVDDKRRERAKLFC